jgi:hypothetical protein
VLNNDKRIAVISALAEGSSIFPIPAVAAGVERDFLTVGDLLEASA